MVKNVVFDLGGVLVDLNPAKVIKQYFSKEDADFILSNIFFSKEWREVDRGVLTPDKAFHKYKDDIAPGAYEKLMDIIETWNEHILGIGRYYEREKLIALFNFSDYDETAWVNEEEDYTDLITGEDRPAKAVGIPAHSFAWLLTRFPEASE